MALGYLNPPPINIHVLLIKNVGCVASLKHYKKQFKIFVRSKLHPLYDLNLQFILPQKGPKHKLVKNSHNFALYVYCRHHTCIWVGFCCHISMVVIEESGSQEHCLLEGNNVFPTALWQPMEQRYIELKFPRSLTPYYKKKTH